MELHDYADAFTSSTQDARQRTVYLHKGTASFGSGLCEFAKQARSHPPPARERYVRPAECTDEHTLVVDCDGQNHRAAVRDGGGCREDVSQAAPRAHITSLYADHTASAR